MKVSELLVEERNKDWKYTEKRVKGALNKVILELEGSDSGAMSRLMTRYKRLDRQWKLMEERRNEVNRQVKDVADRIFDAEDALATRVIETVSYSVMLTKATPASEKEATKKVDYESAYAALARLVPELEEKAKAILEQYTELVPPKDTPSALKYTPKLEEGIAGTVKGWVAKAKAFVKEMFSWGREYDAKLDAFRRKYKLKAVSLKEGRSFQEAPIPPYAVCLSHDGVVYKDDVYAGSKEDCIDYIRKHKAPKGSNFDIMDVDSGMLISYSLRPVKEEKWSGDVDTKWEPVEGFFKKSASAMFESVEEDSEAEMYWGDFAYALSKLRQEEIILKSSKMVYDKRNEAIGREASFEGDVTFTIIHSWKDDGSAKKPVTVIETEHDEIKIGRFSMWSKAEEYAEDIARVLEKHGI